MKNKNVTKSLNLAFFAIAMCIGSSFLQGCSQDDESTAAVSGYTAKQKAEILAFAKQYETTITFNEDSLTDLQTVEDVKSEIKAFAEAFSKKQVLVSLKNGTVGTSNLNSLSSTRRLRSGSETGTWSDSKLYNTTDDGTFSVSVSWIYPDRFSAGSVTVTSAYSTNATQFKYYYQASGSGYFLGSGAYSIPYQVQGTAYFRDGLNATKTGYGTVYTGSPSSSTFNIPS